MKNLNTVILGILFFFITGFRLHAQNDKMKTEILEIIKDKKFDIGISVRNSKGVEIFGHKSNEKYKMYSVSKFFLALKVLHLVDKKTLLLNQNVSFAKSDLKAGLFSPLRDSNPEGITITLEKALYYIVNQSDNNVFDKLVDLSGGIESLNSYISSFTKNKNSFFMSALYRDKEGTIGNNVVTPGFSSLLLYKLMKNKIISIESKNILLPLLETSINNKRIQALVPKNLKSFHKGGTSDRVNNVLIASNDIGIVYLNEKKDFFTIAVFISNSLEDDAVNDAVTAKITEITRNELSNR
ncbi:hypothetical protein ASF10_22085 [Flavobacterium sp. Leaf82]|uniref:serine hydrolase n=1 Tax=Flavobacterium sp. Leaf82 TaxID=1736238 RepID=UPI0006F3A25C|nr:serine hydrolase [Flavobacterium sp. Leaf82]KQO31330.1 hypothetical protein ASF10_22085 [Flavobacterium sp. Leaf82]